MCEVATGNLLFYCTDKYSIMVIGLRNVEKSSYSGFRLRFVPRLSVISVWKSRPRFARPFLRFSANSCPDLDVGVRLGGGCLERKRHE